MSEKPCAYCRQPFTPKDRDQRYCTTRCMYACPIRNKKVAKNRAQAARTQIARTFAKDIIAAGLWVTPELVGLLQKVDKRARERGNRDRVRLAKAS